MPIPFKCPYCKNPCVFPNTAAGTTVACPKCMKSLAIGANMHNWYFKTDSGLEGPFGPMEMKEKGRIGVIRRNTPVQCGQGEWKTADSCGFCSELSPVLQRILSLSVGTGVVGDAPEAAIGDLRERGLCDNQNRLTEKGRVMAISLCPLKRQCEVLGLPYQVCRLPKGNKPELAVMASLKKGECKVAHCEGGAIGLLLQCLSFDRLLPLYRAFAASYGSSDPDQSVKRMHGVTFNCPPRLLKICPDMPSQLVAEIANASENSLVRSFDTLLAWQRHPPGYSSAIPVGCWRNHKWVGVDRELILALFRAFGAARLALIAERLLTDPDAPPFGKGWPDLIWVEGSKVGFIEVKTTDTLLPSQIIAIPKIKRILQVPVEVTQVQWGKPQAAS